MREQGSMWTSQNTMKFTAFNAVFMLSLSDKRIQLLYVHVHSLMFNAAIPPCGAAG